MSSQTSGQGGGNQLLFAIQQLHCHLVKVIVYMYPFSKL